MNSCKSSVPWTYSVYIKIQLDFLCLNYWWLFKIHNMQFGIRKNKRKSRKRRNSIFMMKWKNNWYPFNLFLLWTKSFKFLLFVRIHGNIWYSNSFNILRFNFWTYLSFLFSFSFFLISLLNRAGSCAFPYRQFTDNSLACGPL